MENRYYLISEFYNKLHFLHDEKQVYIVANYGPTINIRVVLNKPVTCKSYWSCEALAFPSIKEAKERLNSIKNDGCTNFVLSYAGLMVYMAELKLSGYR